MIETWFTLDSGPGPAAWNMAVDELLMLRAAATGAPVLRFYSWTEPAATFGYFQKIGDIENWTPLRPLIRRPTGGGLVPHDRDWTYSLAVPPGHWWYDAKATDSYLWVHDWLRRALASLSLTTELAGCCQPEGPGQCFIGAEKSDLLWQGMKIAGAAQRRTRDGLLIQGSVQSPPDGPTRPAWQEAMLNLAPVPSQPKVEWQAMDWETSLQTQAQDLVQTKYSQAAYNRKR